MSRQNCMHKQCLRSSNPRDSSGENSGFPLPIGTTPDVALQQHLTLFRAGPGTLHALSASGVHSKPYC